MTKIPNTIDFLIKKVNNKKYVILLRLFTWNHPLLMSTGMHSVTVLMTIQPFLGWPFSHCTVLIATGHSHWCAFSHCTYYNTATLVMAIQSLYQGLTVQCHNPYNTQR